MREGAASQDSLGRAVPVGSTRGLASKPQKKEQGQAARVRKGAWLAQTLLSPAQPSPAQLWSAHLWVCLWRFCHIRFIPSCLPSGPEVTEVRHLQAGQGQGSRAEQSRETVEGIVRCVKWALKA